MAHTKQQRDFSALRREMRALGYNEGAINDQALRQSLDAAIKRAEARNEKLALELRRVDRASLEGFLGAQFEPGEHSGVTFNGVHNLWRGMDSAEEDLKSLVQSHFKLSDEATEEALGRNEDLALAWMEGLADAYAAVALRDIRDVMDQSRDLLLRIGRDQLVEELTSATDEMIAKSVHEA